MILVYEANDAIEAHMMQDLLERNHIGSRIDGELLQGGIGEIQTMGLVTVLVEEDDFDNAKSIIDEWEYSISSQQLGDNESQPFPFLVFLMGFVVGVIVTVALLVNWYRVGL